MLWLRLYPPESWQGAKKGHLSFCILRGVQLDYLGNGVGWPSCQFKKLAVADGVHSRVAGAEAARDKAFHLGSKAGAHHRLDARMNPGTEYFAGPRDAYNEETSSWPNCF
jgi:hypothetical protein